jgi:hypothetical protein
MRIHTKLSYHWDGSNYILDNDEFFEYNGLLERMCGSTGAQQQVQSSQINFMNQLQSQAGSVFGDASNVFQSLMSTFSPIVAAGPNQQGFSPALLSSLNSQAITQTGQAYKNAAAAVGNAESAINGGNTNLPGGSQIATEDYLASAGANQTANELMGITQANYAAGRQNYENAVSGLEGATNVFNPATSAANAATSAGTAASNTANQIAQEQNSWVGAVTGLAGSLGGAALGGLMNNMSNNNNNNNNASSNPGLALTMGTQPAQLGGINGPTGPAPLAPIQGWNTQPGAYGMWNSGQ